MLARVVLIEDEDLLRDGLERSLRRKGYEVVSVSDPSFCPAFMKSENACTTEQPCGDFILTDNNMPTISGLDFIEMQIKKGCKGAVSNAAVMSAFWSEDDLLKAQKLGCKIFNKPLDLRELLTWLDMSKKALNPDRKLIPLFPK
jgi:DNA-binding response OmpR family regulator